MKRSSEEAKNKLASKLANAEKEHKDLKEKFDKLNHTAKKKTKKLKSELEAARLSIDEMEAKEGHHQLEKQVRVPRTFFIITLYRVSGEGILD